MTFPAKLNALLLVVGLILIVLGRRVYLISIGILGFLGGLFLATVFAGNPQDWRTLLIALLSGVAGSLLAFALHKAAWIFGGFCGGGVLAMYLVEMAGRNPAASSIPVFLAGGAIGALFFLFLLDWALIVVTTLTGAALITTQSGLSGLGAAALFGVLLVLGLLVQGSSLRADRRPKP